MPSEPPGGIYRECPVGKLQAVLDVANQARQWLACKYPLGYTPSVVSRWAVLPLSTWARFPTCFAAARSFSCRSWCLGGKNNDLSRGRLPSSRIPYWSTGFSYRSAELRGRIFSLKSRFGIGAQSLGDQHFAEYNPSRCWGDNHCGFRF